MVGGWRGGFFFKMYSVWRVESGLSMQVLFGRGGGGFIFLSANGKAQGALLLFLLSLRGGVLGVLIGGSELEWEMRRTGWGILE